MPLRVIIDAREFVPARTTGIGRVLCGIAEALVDTGTADRMVLAVQHPEGVPSSLKENRNVRIVKVSGAFPIAEAQLALLAKDRKDLFLSPYPKLPFWGLRARAVHIIHDVFYLTSPGCRKGYRSAFDRLRLQHALGRADLTWYDSYVSMEETRIVAGHCGRHPRMRYPAIEDKFSPAVRTEDVRVLQRYGLAPGYILVTGNGRPHKNLGVLLEGSSAMMRPLVFVGVAEDRRRIWQKSFPHSPAAWVARVEEEDLPAVMRKAFCLAQPSIAEGYGYPPLEAMACGTPAVVSDIQVLRETTGGRALYANPHDPKNWIESFAALEEPDTHRRFAAEGLLRVKPLQGKQAWKDYLNDLTSFTDTANRPG
jgi:glycosyltransferase involved in cell wall biosynthesis